MFPSCPAISATPRYAGLRAAIALQYAALFYPVHAQICTHLNLAQPLRYLGSCTQRRNTSP